MVIKYIKILTTVVKMDYKKLYNKTYKSQYGDGFETRSHFIMHHDLAKKKADREIYFYNIPYGISHESFIESLIQGYYKKLLRDLLKL